MWTESFENLLRGSNRNLTQIRFLLLGQGTLSTQNRAEFFHALPARVQMVFHLPALPTPQGFLYIAKELLRLQVTVGGFVRRHLESPVSDGVFQKGLFPPDACRCILGEPAFAEAAADKSADRSLFAPFVY